MTSKLPSLIFTLICSIGMFALSFWATLHGFDYYNGKLESRADELSQRRQRAEQELQRIEAEEKKARTTLRSLTDRWRRTRQPRPITWYAKATAQAQFLADYEACQEEEKTALNRPYPFLDGHAYKKSVPLLRNMSDRVDHFDSPVMLCEHDQILGPRHSFHLDIVREGRGRFSHYGDGVIFSSSDNSDPNTNGREYSIVIPSK